MSASLEPYAAVGVTILLAGTICAGMLIAAHLLGPRRHGPVKDSPYESGMPIIVDSRRRFNVRFYLVAMLFLLFDVEIVFLWPWVRAFYAACVDGRRIVLQTGDVAGKGFLLIGMAVFFGLLVFGLVYEWRKGALQWE